MTNNNTTTSLNTLDIPIDTTIHRNDIKNQIDLQFKTIHNHEEIDKLLAAGNAQHLHQAHGTRFTVEPLRRLIGKDSFIPFSQEILDGMTYLLSFRLKIHHGEDKFSHRHPLG